MREFPQFCLNYGGCFVEKERPVMEWSKRMKIALGAAKGLAYLHEDCEYNVLVFEYCTTLVSEVFVKEILFCFR